MEWVESNRLSEINTVDDFGDLMQVINDPALTEFQYLVYGETVGLVKDGNSCGYVNLTPVREDEGRVKDCIITRFGISSKDVMFDGVKIDDRYIASLSLDELKKKDMRDIFSLSPVSYEENKGNKYFSLQMQTHPYGLWNRYTIDVNFADDHRERRFEVYTQHTIWE